MALPVAAPPEIDDGEFSNLGVPQQELDKARLQKICDVLDIKCEGTSSQTRQNVARRIGAANLGEELNQHPGMRLSGMSTRVAAYIADLMGQLSKSGFQLTNRSHAKCAVVMCSEIMNYIEKRGRIEGKHDSDFVRAEAGLWVAQHGLERFKELLLAGDDSEPQGISLFWQNRDLPEAARRW